jgi:hypothetical protein
MRMFLAMAAAIFTGGTIAVVGAPATIPVIDLPAAAPFTAGTLSESPPFGGNFGGKPLWLSANGRYVAMFRLTEDTDKNGKLNIDFGLHGDSWGDELMLDVFDLQTGQHQRFDDLLSREPTGRFLVLRHGQDTILFDAGDGSAKNLRDLGGGASGDVNACMSPRQIAFDPDGDGIALLRDEPAQVVVYSPGTGQSRIAYRSEKTLWRVWFTADPGWFFTAEVSGPFPRQMTSCVSNSRTVFAASYSFNGLDDAEITHALIDAQGRRHPLAGQVALIASGIHVTEERILRRLDGTDIPLPEGCVFANGAEGVRVVALDCGKSTTLFDPATGERYDLPAGTQPGFIAGSRTRGPDGDWIGVGFRIGDATDRSESRYRLGRMRLGDLRLERGPDVFFHRFTAHAGWLMGGRNDDYFALNVATGAMYTVRAKDMDLAGGNLALHIGSRRTLLLDPEQGFSARTGRDIGIGNGHGCFIAASGEMKTSGFGGLDKGPWLRVCVGPARQRVPLERS